MATPEFDFNTVIQFVTGGGLGVAGGYLLAYRAQEARISNLEKNQESCEARFNILMQHVLTNKGQ